MFKEDNQKALKKLSLFILSNPIPFNGQGYEKQKGPGTLQVKKKVQRKSFISDVLPVQV